MKLYVSFFILLALSVSLVSGLGIMPSYIENKTIFVGHGETARYYVYLENKDGAETDVRFYLKSSVAVLSDGVENYTLPANYSNTKIWINISVHANALVGSSYPVFYFLKERLNSSDNSTTSSTTTTSGRFNVKVNEEEEDELVETEKDESPSERGSLMDMINQDRAAAIWWNLVIGVLMVTAFLIGVEAYYRKHSKKITSSEKVTAVPLEVKKDEPVLSPDKYFRVVNGIVLKSMEDFKSQLFSIDDLSFDYHVNAKKNDFAAWVEGVFKDGKLADNLRAAHSKEEFGKVLGIIETK